MHTYSFWIYTISILASNCLLLGCFNGCFDGVVMAVALIVDLMVVMIVM